MRRTALVFIVAGNLIFRIAAAQTGESASLLSKENVVDVASGGAAWASGTVGQALAVGDKVRTGEDSRAAVRIFSAGKNRGRCGSKLPRPMERCAALSL